MLNKNPEIEEQGNIWHIIKRNYLFWLSYAIAIFALVICLVFAISTATVGLYVYIMNDKEHLEILSHLGHFLEGTTGIFVSMIAIAAVFIAFIAQRQEIKMQRTEIERNMKRDYRQRIENTFFHLLECYNDIVHNMYFKKENIEIRRRDCFKYMYNEFQKIHDNISEVTPQNDPLTLIELSYSEFFMEYKKYSGNYFRTLYNAIKLIDNSTLDYESKKSYTNLIRAQLSTDELALLFYNCLSLIGRVKFKPFVETYQLVKNLPKVDLIKIAEHIALYDGLEFEEDERKKNINVS